ncbi:MAG: D-alanyl-D-alanine carboxypeptidase/D-alanyl-D-alanine-endopeptidase [Burkholderiales bacterium]|nr:D-alanyl-D-alanine carboxypeptidase/D-alanyl-D-alanine-endopeptidase [Burkholderiales bacterium]
MKRIARLTLTCLLALAAGAAAADDALPPAVLRALTAAGVAPSSLGAVALPLEGGGRPWRWRAEVPMQPASTMKIVTAAVALDRLEPGQRGNTELRSAAPLQGGVLAGDLVLKGGADPDLNVPQFWALLLDLRQQGITTIAGDLVVDRTLFRPARPDLGLPPFDESPEFPYNVVPDALDLNSSLLTIDLESGADALVATPVPPLPGVTIDSRMAISTKPCAAWDEDWKPAQVERDAAGIRIALQGAFPADCKRRVWLQLIDRLDLADQLFRALWKDLGGTWAGHAREGAAPADARLLARHDARSWVELLRPMLKTSDNPTTRLLYLTLGVPAMAADPATPTTALAAAEVRRWFAEQHIDARGLVLDNGSGLSRSERITPLQLARVLEAVHAGPHGPDLAAALPVAGIDGTLKRRLQDGPATGWARLKTGSLRNATAIAGYLRDGRGRRWVLVAFVNDDNAGRARPALDALVDSFARRGPQRGATRATPRRR